MTTRLSVKWLWVALVVLTGARLLRAQEPLLACGGGEAYELTVQVSPDGGSTWQSDWAYIEGNPGQVYDVPLRVVLTVNSGDIQGWSFGLQHDDSDLGSYYGYMGLNQVTTQHTHVPTVQNGIPPDLDETDNIGTSIGYTQAVVIDSNSVFTLSPVTGFVTSGACYAVTFPGIEGLFQVTLSFADTLGSPPVPTVITQDGESFRPCVRDLTLQVYSSWSSASGGYCSPTQDWTYNSGFGSQQPGGATPEPIGIGPDPNEPQQPSVAQMVDVGVERVLDLVDRREEGAPKDRWQYNPSISPTNGNSFQETLGATALCAQAMATAPGFDCSVRRRMTLEHSTRFLIESTAEGCDYTDEGCTQSPNLCVNEINGEPFNTFCVSDSWALFPLQYLVRIRMLSRFPEGVSQNDVISATEELIVDLRNCLRESPHHGVAYDITNCPPATHGSMKTAPALIALSEAKEHGYGHLFGTQEMNEAIEAAAEALDSLRSEEGNFDYAASTPSTSSWGSSLGSAGRNAICETALLLWNDSLPLEKQLSVEERTDSIRRAVENFFVSSHFETYVSAGCGHGTDGVAGFYFTYALYSVSVGIEHLPANDPMRAQLQQTLLDKIRETRGEDGTWKDPFCASSVAPATALVVLALLTLDPQGDGGFRRGDANTDRNFDVSDVTSILGWLFQGTREPCCKKAADVDNSGQVDITDAVFSFDHLFRGGPAPPPPYAERGPEPPDGDELDCLYYPF